MSAPVRILGSDRGGNSHELAITDQGSIRAEVVSSLGSTVPAEVLTRYKLYYEFLTNISGSKDLIVDGSSSPVEFNILAEEGSIKWIQKLRILIEGERWSTSSSGDMRRFGQVVGTAGLSNGILLQVQQSGNIEDIFIEPIEIMRDFFNYTTDFESFPNAVASGVDFLSMDILFTQAISLPFGVQDKLFCTIQDDLEDPDFDRFEMLAIGYQEILGEVVE